MPYNDNEYVASQLQLITRESTDRSIGGIWCEILKTIFPWQDYILEYNEHEMEKNYYDITKLDYETYEEYKQSRTYDQLNGLEQPDTIRVAIRSRKDEANSIPFFTVFCRSALDEDRRTAWVQEQSHLRRALGKAYQERKECHECPLRGAVAVGRMVQFYEYKADGDLIPVWPWGTCEWHIRRDAEHVQGLLDEIASNHH
ncbi:hypothetical protein ASPWEDRAFT_177647 [Aspergillus wentii DTO 134E9]|uniref:Uncharacterized protein n=1 Tax=Aspergillus wentii DTO 134E9 TaxID=1073089 RepID=A0A1L9R4Q7_ASPWE|nr:uncharacterized protein ASPWEDRAFT_177647 [Aspergillus wentii DTO 134E9]KAI9927187.1 hypothetical protein MW887_003571 [Aspergillus wentii]OJJ29915.1 hypothetical protein ASPWEDRAFT_177647 [Aspergillus wentii DTO 134E9]